MSKQLPSPRQLLTSLISSLPQQSSPRASGPLDASTSSNPLKSVSVADRAILTTLHVLFPSLLLQALDLLDRSLVTRVVPVVPQPHLKPASLSGGESELGQDPGLSHVDVAPPQVSSAPLPLPRTDGPSPRKIKKEAASFYLVRSAQSVQQRCRASGSAARYDGSDRSYTVRLMAWNCTCPSFAFSAFPVMASASTLRFRSGGDRGGEGYVDEAEEESFGGLSFDGLEGHTDVENGDGDRGVPCCKHLLACFLADKWGSVLGGFVKERRAGREEMAALGAEG
jgi:hypothetical protein